MADRIFIATPMYGGMCTAVYVQGLLTTLPALQKKGVTALWYNITNESLITRARNELARLFLESDCSHLMFIDADIGFPPDAISYMLEADRDIVCGIYPKKEINWDGVERAARRGQESLQDFAGSFVVNAMTDTATTEAGGVFEVRHGGTGFMLIKREVFEALTPHVDTYRTDTNKDEHGNFVRPLTYEFFKTSIDGTGALLSEDYHFCELWRHHGGKVHAFPYAKLTHVGTHFFGGDILKSGIR
jgi:hypothetical protein